MKDAWRIVVISGGVALLVVGAVLLLLPGPGLVVIAVALTILSSHVVWARRLLRRVKEQSGDVRDSIFRRAKRSTDDPADR